MDIKMDITPSIQWFPGHMTKTKRMIEKNLKMVDLVLEIIDARIPMSSKNPEFDRWLNNKPRIVLLNKADCADENVTRQWVAYFKSIGIEAIAGDCKTGKGLKALDASMKRVLEEKQAQWNRKGMVGRAPRMMIVGVPNVGKSSFINRMAGAKRAKAEDRPGVTRDKQWVTLNNGMELLDTPGVLWPKFEDQSVGEKLAFIGSVKDDVVDTELLAMRLAVYLREYYKDALYARYKLTPETADELEAYDLLRLIARKRGMLLSGNEEDTERMALVFLDEFRGGKIGKISFERPPKKENA